MYLLYRHDYVKIFNYTNQDDYTNDLHIEVLWCLYRWELKLGQKLKTINDQTISLLNKQGLMTFEDNPRRNDAASTNSSNLLRQSTRSLK